MAEVKWIKITTTMFDDEKIKLIESMPEADTLLIIWIKLLVLAGKTNANGYIYLAENIPYTEEMLATLFNRPLTVVRMALQTFEQFGMLSVNEEGIHIDNWEKHQNVQGLEKIREQNRLRKQKQRERQKALSEPEKVESQGSHSMSRDGHAIDIEREEDKDKEKDTDTSSKEESSVPYEKIRELYNSTCKSLSQVRSLSTKRKSHLKARFEQFKYNLKTFEEVFKKLEDSEFCKGDNDRGWKADFDWIMQNDNNMLKVLEGKYDNRKEKKSKVSDVKKTAFHNFNGRTSNYTPEELEEMVLNNKKKQNIPPLVER